MKKSRKPNWAARFYLWTIRRQDLISAHIKLYSWFAIALLLVMALASIITLEAALGTLLVGTLAWGTLLWALVERRRSWLLSLEDPVLRQQAHRIMLQYLTRKGAPLTKRSGAWRPPWRNGCPNC